MLDLRSRSILSFDTSAIPANAIITRVTLRLREGAPNPELSGPVWVDQAAAFGESLALAPGDFGAPADVIRAAQLAPAMPPSHRVGDLTPAGIAAIDRAGRTQFRLYYGGEPTTNAIIGFHSGDDPIEPLRPQLAIEYVMP